MTVTYEELHKILNYNPENGLFTSRVKKSRRLFVGRTVGHISKSSGGYVVIRINGKNYYAHRLAWLYVHGYMPENFIDHIDRDRANNRIKNLREVSASCNTINSKLNSNNTSGIKGVRFNKKSCKWEASIKINRKEEYLGSFDNKDDAARARWDAEVRYGFVKCISDSTSYLYLKERSLI